MASALMIRRASIDDPRTRTRTRGCDVLTVTRLGKIAVSIALVLSAVAASAKPISHEVREGDTLWVMAKKYHTTPKQIAKANGISENSTLKLGKKLCIPSKFAQPKAVSRHYNKRAEHCRATKQVHAKKSDAVQTASARTGNGNLINSALDLCGSRYVRGGVSRSGFDCSGFTRYVFAKYGIALPHSSAAQANLGRPVSRGELRSGDLVFFHTNRSGISHVAIYIGNGKIVHAATYGRGVRVDSLNSGYYSSHYRCARRVK